MTSLGLNDLDARVQDLVGQVFSLSLASISAVGHT
jgi:hypothetical protein